MPPTDVVSPRPEFARAFSDPESFATTLIVALVDTYGTEFLQWDPETILLEIQDDFRVKLPQGNFDRIMVGVELLTTDDFYVSAPDFIHYCNVLAGGSLDPAGWDPADPDEIAWGITETMLLSPPTSAEPFSEEILVYIGKTLDEYGIINPPDVLKIAFRERDPSQFVQKEFTDDPEMFDAVYKLEADKTAAVDELVRGNLRRLADQLRSLPLRNGSTEEIVERTIRALEIPDRDTFL